MFVVHNILQLFFGKTFEINTIFFRKNASSLSTWKLFVKPTEEKTFGTNIFDGHKKFCWYVVLKCTYHHHIWMKPCFLHSRSLELNDGDRIHYSVRLNSKKTRYSSIKYCVYGRLKSINDYCMVCWNPHFRLFWRRFTVIVETFKRNENIIEIKVQLTSCTLSMVNT